MAAYEQRKVVTLVGERGWHEPDNSDYDEGSVDRGYRSMNADINKLAKGVTIHSVSYSHIIITYGPSARIMRIYATLVYSGNVDLTKVFGKTDYDGKEIKPDTTLINVYL